MAAGTILVIEDDIIQREGLATDSGVVLGTPAYMAPEQAKACKIDGRADLFRLGCVLYEMTTGQRPFRGDTPLAVLLSIARNTPTPVAKLNPTAPPRLVALIDQLLAKRPEQRPASAHIAARELEAIESELTKAAEQDTVTQPKASMAPSLLLRGRDGCVTGNDPMR